MSNQDSHHVKKGQAGWTGRKTAKYQRLTPNSIKKESKDEIDRSLSQLNHCKECQLCECGRAVNCACL